MSLDNLDYKEIRIGAKITYAKTSGTASVDLAIPNRINITKRRDIEPIDGLEAGNQGVNIKYPRYTWSLAIPVHTVAIRLLQNLADTRAPFKIDIFNVGKESSSANAFKLFTEILDKCYITSVDGSYVINEVTYLTFSGIALRYERGIPDATTYKTFTTMFGADIVSEIETSRAEAMVEWEATNLPTNV